MREPRPLLENLPDDVIANILRFLKHSRDVNRTALVFARGSEERRRAVMFALDHRLVFQADEGDIHRDLILFFGDIVREISLMQVSDEERLFQDIFHLPQLRKACVYAEKEQLQIIRNSPCLTNLEIVVDFYTDWEGLIATFESLPLANLIMHVNSSRNVPEPEKQRQLAEACPKVVKMALFGRYSNLYYHEMVQKLPSLRCLSIERNPSEEEFLGFLSSLEEVELRSEFTIREASQIGHPVRMLRLGTIQEAHDILGLNHCTNLRELCIAVQDGEETALLGKTRNLEVLHLRWEEPPFWGEYEYDWNEDEEIYYQPDGAFLLELVRSSPKLRELSLEHAVVTNDYLQGILQIMGDRLEKLAIQLKGQGEDALDRLEMILNAVARWCPNIRTLDLMEDNNNVYASYVQKHSCFVTLKITRMKCEKLNTEKIRDFIYKLLPIPKKRSILGSSQKSMRKRIKLASLSLDEI